VRTRPFGRQIEKGIGKSLAEAIINVDAISQEIKKVSDSISDIKELNSNPELLNILNSVAVEVVGLTKISDNITKLMGIINNVDRLLYLADNITALKDLTVKIDKVSSIYSDMCYMLEKHKNLVGESTALNRDIKSFFHNNMVPYQENLVTLNNELRNQLATDVQNITAGHEVANKLLTYTMVTRPCWTEHNHPYILIDDVAQEIVFCANMSLIGCPQTVDVPDTVIQDVVNHYLTTIHFNDNECVCDEITQGDVDDVFDAPPSVVAPTIACTADHSSIQENNAIGATIRTLTGDNGGETATWSISHGSDYFDITQSGVVTAKIVYDYETTNNYAVRAYYTNSVGTAECWFMVDIINENENSAPTVNAQAFTIEEGNNINDVIGQLVVASDGGDNNIFFTLDSNDHFESNTNGELTAKEVYDYDVLNQFTANVIATNGIGDSQPALITINVSEEACVEVSACMTLIDFVEVPQGQNLPAGTVVGTPDVVTSATEWQEGCPINFELVDNSLLTFNGTNFVNTNELAIGEYTTDYITRSLSCTQATLTRTLRVIEEGTQTQPVSGDSRILSAGEYGAVLPVGQRIASVYNTWGDSTTFSYVSGGISDGKQMLGITTDGDFYIRLHGPLQNMSDIIIRVTNAKGSADLTYYLTHFHNKLFSERRYFGGQ
jgi:hypothetical protein